MALSTPNDTAAVTLSKLTVAIVTGGGCSAAGDASGECKPEVAGQMAEKLNNLCVFTLIFNLLITIALMTSPFQKALKHPIVACTLTTVLVFVQLYNCCLEEKIINPLIKLEGHFNAIVTKWSRTMLFMAIFAIVLTRPGKPSLIVYGLFSLLFDGFLLAWATGTLNSRNLFSVNVFLLQNIWTTLVGIICLSGVFTAEMCELEKNLAKLIKTASRNIKGALHILSEYALKKKAKAIPFRHLCRADGSNCNSVGSSALQVERQSGQKSSRIVKITGLKERLSRRCEQISTLCFEWTIENFYEVLDQDFLTSSSSSVKYIDSNTFSPSGQPQLIFFLRMHLPAAATAAAVGAAGTSGVQATFKASQSAHLQLHLDAMPASPRVVLSFSTTVDSKIKPRFVRQFFLCPGGFTNLATLNPAHFKSTDAYLDESGDLRLQCKLHILGNISPFASPDQK